MRAACDEWTWCISFGCHRHRAIAWTEATNLRRGIRRCCRRSKGPAVVHVFAARPRASRGVGFQRQAFSGGVDRPGRCDRFPVSTRGIHAFAFWDRRRGRYAPPWHAPRYSRRAGFPRFPVPSPGNHPPQVRVEVRTLVRTANQIGDAGCCPGAIPHVPRMRARGCHA